MENLSITLRLTTLSSIDTAESVDEVMELVFYDYDSEFDWKASVYSVSLNRVDQIKSEHTGNIKRQPETKGAVIIRPSSLPLVPNNDGGFFKYRREHHQEIHFSSEQEARLLAEQIFNDLKNSVIITNADSMNNYISDKIKEFDSEWFSACEDSRRVRKWVASLCGLTTNQLNDFISENK